MEPEDAEALRRRLYRPDASAADLAVYLRATEEERVADDRAGPTSPVAQPKAPIRPVVLGGLVVAALALLGAALLTSGEPTRAVTPTAVGTQRAAASWQVASSRSIVFDGGERAHARGSSVAEGPEAVRYTVASGDRVAAIAGRFQLCPGDVLRALPYGFDPARLPAGESLELSRDGASTC